ncbi:MAG: GNAT family N-acetyltransferase [Schleiferiaceae bacterium]
MRYLTVQSSTLTLASEPNGPLSLNQNPNFSTESLQLKPLTKDGLQTLVGWAREEGWNPGDHDYEAFWAADPEGYVGFYHKGELIAGGAVVSYGGAFGFMGLFIVHPNFRGSGIGESLWHQRRDLLLSRLKPRAAIGMDGVVAMQPFYEKGGFSIAFRDERYELMGKPFDQSPDLEIELISEFSLDSIFTFDAQCLGYDRRPFLKSWLTLPESHGFLVKEKESILGYAVIRKVGEGHKIGPLFADNSSIAEELLKACLNAVPDEKVYFDVAVNHPKALALAKKYGGKYVFECARMYHGNPPATDWKKVFGITTFELG